MDDSPLPPLAARLLRNQRQLLSDLLQPLHLLLLHLERGLEGAALGPIVLTHALAMCPLSLGLIVSIAVIAERPLRLILASRRRTDFTDGLQLFVEWMHRR